MDSLMPIFRVLPVPLVIYGMVRSTMEILEVRAVTLSAYFSSAGTAQERWVAYASYLRALDSLFFYAAMAALVAFAIELTERKI